jgi:hypothetical protein
MGPFYIDIMDSKYKLISSESDDNSEKNKSSYDGLSSDKPKMVDFVLVKNKYKNYIKSKLDWNEIFKEIKELKDNVKSKFIKSIAIKYDINYRTLKNKYNNWENNECPEVKNYEFRGLNTLFSEKEEEDLFEYIKKVYIETDLFFDDECLGILAKKKWDQLYPLKKDDFQASRSWVYNFKKRWRLSTFKGRNSKKASMKDLDEIPLFLETVNKFLRNNPPSSLFNFDETFWRLLNKQLNSIGLTGSENRKILTSINNKKGFTSIFLISGDGKFHKATIILKGKTKKSINNLTVNQNVKDFFNITHSGSGWNNESITIDILNQIHLINKGNKSALILDQFKCHKGDEIIKKASELNIQLIFVPVGQTANYQPLDININGVLKNTSHKYIKNLFIDDPYYKLTLSDGIKSLKYSISKLDKTIIKNSFACFTF